MTESDSNNCSNIERDWLDKRLRQAKDYFFNFCFFFLPGTVSKVHLQEAIEKYWILWRDVEILFNTEVDKLGIEGICHLPHDPKNVDEFVKTEIRRMDKMPINGPSSIGKRVKNKSKLNDSTDKGRSKLKHLLNFYKILVKDRARLTRREKHLNILWRDITFIRTRMLTEGIFPCKKLPSQLDYCIGEAARLGIQDNEEIRELIHEAAVELDNTDSPKVLESNKRLIRNIVRILTRLNNKRLQNIREQRAHKLMYQAAFFIFLILSCILLYNHKQVLALGNENNVCEQIRLGRSLEEKAEKTTSADEKNREDHTRETDIGKKSDLLEKLSALMEVNVLFFIFFAGLIGGFLSTVMRLGQGPKDIIPGNDAYYAWYVLTKPVVGAFGAAILYVIVKADFVPVEIFNEEFLKTIKCYPVGAKGFAFGCIMGFSERIIMPKVK